MTRKELLEKLRQDLVNGVSAESTLSYLLDALISDEIRGQEFLMLKHPQQEIKIQKQKMESGDE